MKYTIILSLTMNSINSDTVDEGKAEVTLRANQIIREFNDLTDCEPLTIMEVKYNPGIESLRSVEEADELRNKI